MKSVDADMTMIMNIITTMTMKNVDADMTMITSIIMITTMKNVDADTTMTIIITIMQMKCSQAGGKETTKKYTKEGIHEILEALSNHNDEYGMVLRAKGMVEGEDGQWIYFDMVRVKQMYVKVHRNTPEESASSVLR